MSGHLTAKLEAGLATYLQDNFQGTGEPLAGLAILSGHRSGDIEAADQIVITAVNPGGPLAYVGIYDIEVQLLLVTRAAPQEDESEDDPVTRHHERAQVLVDIFCRDQMGTVVTALNAQGNGYGTSCFDSGSREDAKNASIFATGIPLLFTAHLAASTTPRLVDEAGNLIVDESGNRILVP